MEAHITAGLNHRNVVRTIAHAWRPLVSHVSASMSVWDSAGSNAVGPFTACNEGETWLLLELCDKGTLQVLPWPPHMKLALTGESEMTGCALQPSCVTPSH